MCTTISSCYRCYWPPCATFRKSMVCPPPDRIETIFEKWIIKCIKFPVQFVESSNKVSLLSFHGCPVTWLQFLYKCSSFSYDSIINFRLWLVGILQSCERSFDEDGGELFITPQSTFCVLWFWGLGFMVDLIVVLNPFVKYFIKSRTPILGETYV